MTEQAFPVYQFIQHLKLLREEVGHPSLGDLSRLSRPEGGDHVPRSSKKYGLTKSTLDDHLNHRRAQLPSWEFVSAFFRACQRYAHETGRDISHVGTLEEWFELYRSVRRGDTRAPAPVRRVDDSSTMYGEVRPLSEASDASGTQTMDLDQIFAETKEENPRSADALGDSTSAAVLVANTGSIYYLTNKVTTVGRFDGVDIYLMARSVSRRHAEFIRRDTRFSIRDTDSLNGTYINRQRITDETLLVSGDRIVMGEALLIFYMRQTS